MPRGKVKKAVTKKITPKVSESFDTEPMMPPPSLPTSLPKWAYPALVAFLIVALAGLYLWNNKSLLLAATVNGAPIWRWQVVARLNEKFGPAATDEFVNEQIILSAASKKKITASESEVSNKVTEIEKTLEGRISLKDALEQQGLSEQEFRRQIGLQIMIEKLTADKTPVTEKEISDYLTANRSMMIGTQEAQLKEEAKSALVSQKQASAFKDLFDQLKSEAKVVKF